MLFEVPSISMKGTTIIEKFALNIANTRQFRCKLTAINGNNRIPLDVAVTSISPSICMGGAKIEILGIEMGKNLKIKLTAEYSVIKRSTSVKGNIGSINIFDTLANKEDAIKLLQTVASEFTKI